MAPQQRPGCSPPRRFFPHARAWLAPLHPIYIPRCRTLTCARETGHGPRRSSSPSSRSCCCRLRLWRSICSPSPPISTCRNSASASTASTRRGSTPCRCRWQCQPFACRVGIADRRTVHDKPRGHRSARCRARSASDVFSSRGRLVVTVAAADLDRGAGAILARAGGPVYDPANGTVVVRVRAFTPAEALQLAQAIVAASEQLVNDLSTRARHDALRNGESEVTHAETRLKAVLGEIRAFRDREGLIDPAKTAEVSGTIAARLKDELVRANAELSTLKSYMQDDAPSVKVLKARIRSLEGQQRVVARDLTDRDPNRDDTLSRQLGSYEQLESERRFAEAAYQHALHGLDQARANADRQQVYIASFVPPSLPEEALYPRRWRSLAVVALIAFAVWAIGGLAVQSIRDHF